MFGLMLMAFVLCCGFTACGDDDKAPVEEPVTDPASGYYFQFAKDYAITHADYDWTSFDKHGEVIMHFSDKDASFWVTVKLKKDMLNKVIDLSKTDTEDGKGTWSILANGKSLDERFVNDYYKSNLAETGTMQVQSFGNDIFHVTINYYKNGAEYKLVCKGKFRADV